MKVKKLKLFLLPVLVLFFLAGSFLLFRVLYSSKNAAPFLLSDHRIAEFGTYPQTRITEEALIAELNQLHLKWKSYGYYIGNGSYGSAQQGDYMQYADVTFNGETYRAVRFSAYRPYCCHKKSMITSPSDYYGLTLHTVYWYRYEPIRWIVLDENRQLLLSEKILDTQPINSVVYVKDADKDSALPDCYKDPAFSTYSTDYYSSDMRHWLNSTFFDTAFSHTEAAQITDTELDNSAWNKRYTQFDSPNSCDKVFLLSYSDVTNPEYGFSRQSEKTDDLRTAYPTDYALSQGIWTVGGIYKKGASWWWLRSGGIISNYPCAVSFYGAVVFSIVSPYGSDCVDTGVRPAIVLKTDGQ